jgi:hypothetical protein
VLVFAIVFPYFERFVKSEPEALAGALGV